MSGLDTAEELRRLGSDPQLGLSAADAADRLTRHGPNELPIAGGPSVLRLIWSQLSSALIALLVVAAGVSLLLGETVDAAAILVIVVLNAALGFSQEFRAEKALAALRELAVPTVRVRRGGTLHEVPARELVPGDVLVLEAGNRVPADARLIESANLQVQEAALTGESAPVSKSTEARSDADAALAERSNCVFMGTLVTYGRAEAVVTATGIGTELGRIASLLRDVGRDPTPLQRRLARFGRTLALAAIALVAVVFALGVLGGQDPRLVLLTALSLAVAAVPEGLPAVATVCLALGGRRLLQREALIRKLPAVEALGSVTVICSDKTGTLTENRMTVTVMDVAGETLDLGRQRATAVDAPESVRWPRLVDEHASVALMVVIGALCNDAELAADEGGQDVIGDPTEAAFVAAAARMGLRKPDLEAGCPRIGEVPFGSERKRMSTLHRLEGDDAEPNGVLRAVLGLASGTVVALVKGGVDSVLERCTHAWLDGRVERMDGAVEQRILSAHEALAEKGMRVLGLAFRRLDAPPDPASAETVEVDLVFVGMMGLIDPPRPEVREAVARCRTAGIRPIMITGDHPLTASAIAGQLGIDTSGGVVTGTQLEAASDDELTELCRRASVHARVAPEHKLRIVAALQRDREVVAMTGDGVNDAPALKKADIGVAMGITGTDVSKEAASMVLLDDNFATIVNAVEQGRVIFDNVRKFVRYTLTSNAGEIWVMLLGPLVGMPLALLPLQILWVNLVTDGLPGLALAVEPGERGTMRRPPRPLHQSMLAGGVGRDIVVFGLLMGLVSLGVGWAYWRAGASTEHWRTMVFTVLTLSQMGNALAVRSERDSLFRIGPFTNRLLLAAIGLTFVLQLAVVYAPPLQAVFRTTSLTGRDLALALALSTVVFWATEIAKVLDRSRRERAG